MSHARNVRQGSNHLLAFTVLKELVKAKPLQSPFNNEELQHKPDYVFDVLSGVCRVAGCSSREEMIEGCPICPGRFTQDEQAAKNRETL